VAFLTSGGGGSGTFLNLAVVGRAGEEVVSRAVVVVGDRVQLRDARVEVPHIVLDLVQHGEDDPLCCPGDLAKRIWRLEGDQLVEEEEQVTGRLHPSILTDTEWVLRMWTEGDSLPLEPEITLLFGSDQVSGSAGCNGFFSGYDSEGAPGAFFLGPVGATRMMCEPALMEVEARYLALLSEVRTLGFWNGYLALSTSENGRTMRLLFRPR
jgi:heat shock protein HslJ